MYDFIIIGAGPCGIFAAYEASVLKPGAKIALLEKGLDIHKRRCPISEGYAKFCPNREADLPSGCLPACSITCGFGGAGAFSDGKFNITSEFGGWLGEYISNEKLLELINSVDKINLSHGAPDVVTDPSTPEAIRIERKAYAAGMKLLKARVRHFGTEKNLSVLKSIFSKLKERIDMRFCAEVEDILIENEKAVGARLTNGEEIRGRAVLVAPGRDGSGWLSKILKSRKVAMHYNQVDIGLRAEVSNVIMQEINEALYEAKLIYASSCGIKVRTFCANPSGHVVVENHSGIMAANGHAFFDPDLGSENTNFALLASHQFTRPFNKPNEYAREICARANDLTNGGVMVQTFGDILRERRSNEKRIGEGFVRPTLKEAVPGDLGLCLPYNTMKSIIEMTRALDKVIPGFASDHTLFYGVEAKFYSAQPEVDANMQTPIKNLYVGGDGAGFTRGLAQASAMGVLIARAIFGNS